MSCPCGLPLHYTVPVIQETVEKMIAERGDTVLVTTPGGTWRVPRHYIALHGVKVDELSVIARKLGFEEIR